MLDGKTVRDVPIGKMHMSDKSLDLRHQKQKRFSWAFDLGFLQCSIL